MIVVAVVPKVMPLGSVWDQADGYCYRDQHEYTEE